MAQSTQLRQPAYDSVYAGRQRIATALDDRITARARWFLVSAIIQVGLSFVLSPVATLLGCCLTVAIIWLARPHYLPALVINQLNASHFAFVPDAAGDDAGTFALAGIPFNTEYVLAVVVAARVTWELLRNPTFFRGSYWLLGLWYLTIVPAIVMAVAGKIEGNSTWTLPIRTACMCGAYFYGAILARSWSPDGRVVTRGLLPVVCGVLFFVALGVFTHKFRFILAPAAVPIAWFAWEHGGWWEKAVAAATALLALMQGLGIVVPWRSALESMSTTAALERFGDVGTTLTSNMLFFGSVSLCVIGAFAPKLLWTRVARSLGAPAFLAVLGFSVAIAVLGPKYWQTNPREVHEDTIRDRIREKLFDDRSRIWHFVLMDAVSAPYLLKPTGRIIVIEESLYGPVDWPYGAHNAILNTLRHQRWLNGTIILTIVVVAMWRNACALRGRLPGGIHPLAICVALTGVVGMVVNDYPLDPVGSFWFLGLAGVVAAANLRTDELRAGQSIQVRTAPRFASSR